MNKKGQWWIWTQVGLWVIIVLVIIWGGVSLYNASKISKVLEEQGKEIAGNLQKTNALLEKYEKLPVQIEEIKTEIGTLKEKTDNITIDTNKLNEIESSLNKDVGRLNNVLTDLDTLQKKMFELQNKYPPVQTQNILFQNMSKEEANILIQNAINQRSWNLILTFAFGSLIGFSISLVSLYFIFKKYVIK